MASGSCVALGAIAVAPGRAAVATGGGFASAWTLERGAALRTLSALFSFETSAAGALATALGGRALGTLTIGVGASAGFRVSATGAAGAGAFASVAQGRTHGERTHERQNRDRRKQQLEAPGIARGTARPELIEALRS